FFFAPGQGAWCVVQQGMNTGTRYARRYHWLSEQVASFVSDPHAAVACDARTETLNLVAGEGQAHRQALTSLSREHPDRVLRELRPYLSDPDLPLFRGLDDDGPRPAVPCSAPQLRLPPRHTLTVRDITPGSLKKVLIKTYERQPQAFEDLLGQPGIGPQALRSLS